MAIPRVGETHVDNGSFTIGYVAGVVTGSISLSGNLTTAIGAAATTVRPYVTVTGDMLIPDGTVLAELILSTPATLATSLIGSSDAGVVESDVTLYPNTGNVTTLTLHFNGASSASLVFTGQG